MNDQYQLCKSLIKGDLHVHLNGLFNTELIKKVLLDEQTNIPEGFDLAKDLNVLHHKHSLTNYLKPWNLLRLMPKTQVNLAKLIDGAFESLKEDNIRFIELRSTVVYLSLLMKRDLESILLTLISELNNASNKYGVRYGLILTISRGENSLIYLTKLIDAYQNIGCPKEIVGLDLAGDEDIPITKELGINFKSLKDKYGLKITIHAGETGKVENIYEAINIFGADRIGHGTAAGLSDETMNLLAKKDICVEVCPISNRRTGAVKAKDAHPVRDFIKNEVPFVICSDNPSIHAKTLSDDYFEFLKETKRLDYLQGMYNVQQKYTFLK